jgi:Zn-dependent peptidase ImmA (M78 family)/DNA-binding XRE family transcriptional regulator
MGDALHNLAKRLSEVRTLANQTQTGLARKLGVSASLISHWEKGTRTPDESQLLDLARHLGVALDYLLNSEIRPHFKCRAQTTSPQGNEIDQAMLNASEQIHFIDTALRMAKQPPVPLSLWAEFDSFENLPNIAGNLRDTLKLNRRVTLGEFKQALSERNIFVFDWAMPWHLSGLSYRGPFTAIFINSEHSVARRLFTLAHEFAHVVFHLGREDRETRQRIDTVVSALASHRDPLEKQANAFAGEFLMPQADLKAIVESYGSRLKEPSCLERVAQEFNVSRDAIFYRLTKLNVFRWTEKNKYFRGEFQTPTAPTCRVANIDAQVDARFRNVALGLHEDGQISNGKLAQWFFTKRHIVEDYLDELARDKDLTILDDSNHEGEPAGAS